MIKALVPYKPNYGDLEQTHAEFHTEQFKQSRHSLLSELRCLSGLPEIARTLNPDTLYKVVLPEGKLLQQGKDGLFRGVFYGEHGVDQHAKFTEVRTSLVEAAKTLGSQVLLISIAMQLSRIEKMVENLAIEMHRDRIAEILSGVDQFEKAMHFQDVALRGNAILNAVQSLHTGLRKTIAELGSRIAEAPNPENRFWYSFWYHLVPFHNNTKQAAKIMGLAQESFHAALLGIKTLAECYSVLGEIGAANKALSDYFDMVLNCNIQDAAEKARLVAFTGSVAPQAPWESFIKIHPTVRERIQVFSAIDAEKKCSAIEIEFMPNELEGDDDANLS